MALKRTQRKFYGKVNSRLVAKAAQAIKTGDVDKANELLHASRSITARHRKDKSNV